MCIPRLSALEVLQTLVGSHGEHRPLNVSSLCDVCPPLPPPFVHSESSTLGVVGSVPTEVLPPTSTTSKQSHAGT